MNKIRLVFAGTPEFAKVALGSLIDNAERLNIDIVAVYTQPDRKAGRGQKLTASPVKELALSCGIPVEQPVSFSLKYCANDNGGRLARKTLADYRPDVMVVAAYGLILPAGVLAIPVFGCLNIHASLLPRWRGAAPIQRAILAGDDATGVTIMQMAQGLDTGDMLHKMTCNIDECDTTQSLHDKLASLGAQAIGEVLSDLPAYQDARQIQDDALASYANKITTSDGQIDWQKDVHAIHRQIRALGAYTFLGGERIKVLSVASINPAQTTELPAGTIVSVGKKALLVAAGRDQDGRAHLINLTSLQWPGGKPLHALQIANSNKIQDGQTFGNGV